MSQVMAVLISFAIVCFAVEVVAATSFFAAFNERNVKSFKCSSNYGVSLPLSTNYYDEEIVKFATQAEADCEENNKWAGDPEYGVSYQDCTWPAMLGKACKEASQIVETMNGCTGLPNEKAKICADIGRRILSRSSDVADNQRARQFETSDLGKAYSPTNVPKPTISDLHGCCEAAKSTIQKSQGKSGSLSSAKSNAAISTPKAEQDKTKMQQRQPSLKSSTGTKAN